MMIASVAGDTEDVLQHVETVRYESERADSITGDQLLHCVSSRPAKSVLMGSGPATRTGILTMRKKTESITRSVMILDDRERPILGSADCLPTICMYICMNEYETRKHRGAKLIRSQSNGGRRVRPKRQRPFA
jgi:hypothetical protein